MRQMPMQRIFIRERTPYSIDHFAEIINASESEATDILKRLLADGAIRPFKDNTSSISKRFQFKFVGLVMTGNRVFICFPKYLRCEDDNAAYIMSKMKLIMRVLKSFSSKMDIAFATNDTSISDNSLSIMLLLLDMFDEHGTYSSVENVCEPNGPGAIDWNRTINERLPLIDNGQVIYLDYVTKKAAFSSRELIPKIHKAILTECSGILHECYIDDLLGLSDFELTELKVDDLGDTDALLLHLERERNIQFVTWKQNVLDLMSKYLLNRSVEAEVQAVQRLGTTSFYHVWEVACKTAFSDMLKLQLGQLQLDISADFENQLEKSLHDIIPHPQWARKNPGGFADPEEADTFNPDIVAIREYRGAKLFCIYDAKYYTPSEAGEMDSRPGVYDVAKQFMYQSGYRNYIDSHKFDNVINAFLIPGDVENVELMAKVEFPDMIPKEKHPFKNQINMWILPAEKVFEAFLDGEEIDGETLAVIYAYSVDPNITA